MARDALWGEPMTITIPEWVLWILGIWGGMALIFFAFIGIQFYFAFKNW
jgi:hypothetical protein